MLAESVFISSDGITQRLTSFHLEVKLPSIDGINIDAFWPFWPTDRAFGSALWLGVDLDKQEGTLSRKCRLRVSYPAPRSIKGPMNCLQETSRCSQSQ